MCFLPERDKSGRTFLSTLRPCAAINGAERSNCPAAGAAGSVNKALRLLWNRTTGMGDYLRELSQRAAKSDRAIGAARNHAAGANQVLPVLRRRSPPLGTFLREL
jgi:hypothetical protein